MKLYPGVGLAITLLFSSHTPLWPQKQVAIVAPLTTEQITARLEAKNRERAQALQELEGFRLYRMEYRGLPGSKDAEMTARMNFHAPASKQFAVIQQSGSKLLIDHVFKKLLQSEQEAMDPGNLRRTSLTLENYDFTLTGYESWHGGPCYVLTVAPRTKNKFLYRGKVWVNAQDFAVVHIEAQPAQSPSFWIKKTKIEHDYVKVGDFWLPAQNRSESQIRFGGRASLTIDYTDYKIISVALPGKQEIAKSQRPAERETPGLAAGPIEYTDMVSAKAPPNRK